MGSFKTARSQIIRFHRTNGRFTSVNHSLTSTFINSVDYVPAPATGCSTSSAERVQYGLCEYAITKIGLGQTGAKPYGHVPLRDHINASLLQQNARDQHDTFLKADTVVFEIENDAGPVPLHDTKNIPRHDLTSCQHGKMR